MKQSDKKGKKNQVGAYGEEIGATYLQGKGFEVISHNYLKKWGEIDLVARETSKKGQMMHFVEVKTVSYETKQLLKQAISRGTWRPEENVHAKKLQRLNRAIESWIMEHNYAGEWQIDVLAVRLVPSEKYASVKLLDNIIV